MPLNQLRRPHVGNYRATIDPILGHTVVQEEKACINGLAAWVTVADLGKEEPEDEMFGGLDREALAARIVAILGAPVSKQLQPLTDDQVDTLYVSKLAGKGFDNIAVAFRAMVRAVEKAHGIDGVA